MPITFQPRKPFRHRAREAEQSSPTPPPAPAVVTSAFISGGYMVCNLVFDRPIALAGSPPYDFSDGAIQFNDQNPVSVTILGGAGGTTLACTVSGGVGPGGSWNVNAQPTWLATTVAVPQGGNFE